MKTFTITQQNGTEHTVSVDGDDWDLVSKHTWGVHYQNGYANIDHIDRNPLNNCRTNLRFATQREQIINQRMKSTNTSGVKGVCWHKAANKWEVGIDNKHVGLYETFEKACEARVEAENAREFLLCESVSLC